MRSSSTLTRLFRRARQVARAFTRTFTANDGTLRRMSAAEVSAVADATALNSQTLVAGGFSNTVCVEALREFTVEVRAHAAAAAITLSERMFRASLPS